MTPTDLAENLVNGNLSVVRDALGSATEPSPARLALDVLAVYVDLTGSRTDGACWLDGYTRLRRLAAD
jgi:hypothetical protein